MISISSRIHFSIGFSFLPVPVRGVWGILMEFLDKEKVLPGIVELSQMAGHSLERQSEKILKLSTADVGNLIFERDLQGFKIYSGKSTRGCDYYLLDYRSERKDFKMGCAIEPEAKAPSDWSSLIERIMAYYSSMGGWQYIHSYQFWQGDSVGDRFYEIRWGCIPPGYRTWAETVPGPVPQPDNVLLDISLNPGRCKQLTPQVNFLPTAEMWLGPHFWQYAKCTKEEALAADFWLETRDEPNYSYFKCWPTAFTRPDGEQGRMQQRLWKLSFHEDCEWPPGSGTICDEPMYGPPELLPNTHPNPAQL